LYIIQRDKFNYHVLKTEKRGKNYFFNIYQNFTAGSHKNPKAYCLKNSKIFNLFFQSPKKHQIFCKITKILMKVAQIVFCWKFSKIFTKQTKKYSLWKSSTFYCTKPFTPQIVFCSNYSKLFNTFFPKNLWKPFFLSHFI